MPHFYILQVIRSDSPENRAECQIKFYPILENRGASPLAIEAEDESGAWKLVKERFPRHFLNLAIHETTSYDRTVRGLIAKRLLRGNQISRVDLEAKGSIGYSDVAGDSGIPASREIGSAENAPKAEHAY